MNITVKRHDGTEVPFNADRINRSIERACVGLSDPVAKVTQIASETQLTLYNGITTDELDQATINAAVQNIKDDPDYDKVATRLLLKIVYRQVIGDYDNDNYADLQQKHRDGFVVYIKKLVASGRLDPKMEQLFDLSALANSLNLENDELLTYAGLDGLLKRYSLKFGDKEHLETPQYFFMRVAMGLSYNEKDPTSWAQRFYHKMSRLEYIMGGSCNLAAGSPNPSLSNCILMEVHDDMNHIAKAVSDVLILSKASAGIGVSMTKLRASGSVLASNNGVSSGPTPFAKIMDTSIRAVIRGGKKVGALCFYMENWHLDFPEFLDWKQNGGDDYMRMRTANTAVFMSDEFMRRVEQKLDWYMFDPKETPDLNELYGKAFAQRYTEYIEMAESGKLRMWKKVPAEQQYRQILVSLQTTSHPWLTWKDTINLRALNDNTGTIHMSNLCTEICLPQDKDHIAVCNLASINLATHVRNKEVNWARLEDSVRLAVRQLDNLIDINTLPIPEARRGDRENRAIGLGVMGFADVLEQLGMAYDSVHAANFADRIFEFISYMAIDESANLAKDRGAYMHFAGSGWSFGKVPFDTIAELEAERGRTLSVDKSSYHKGLNWDVLRTKVRLGMRNATLMAVAPTANIGLVAGVTPGIDVRFAQIFSRNKFSGKYVDINRNLVKDLQNLGIWDNVKDLIVEHQGDIADIPGIPQHIKDIYKTSFSTSPYAVIEIAARAQKWIDQALSRNMYLDTRDNDEIMNIYKAAWEKGVKTTYYLHMKPRHTAEQSTIAVNKAEKIGKVGFGALNFSKSPAFSAPLQKSLDITPHESPVVVPVPSPMTEPLPVTVAASPVAPAMQSPAPEVFTPRAAVEVFVPHMPSVVEQEPVHKGFSSVAPVASAAAPAQTFGGGSYEPMVSEHRPYTPTAGMMDSISDPAEAEANVCISCQ